MIAEPNPADFSVNERTGEYEITISIDGKLTLTIKADSIEQAKALAQDMADKIVDGDEGADLDEVSYARVSHCRHVAPLFRVVRDGCPIQVSHLLPGDVPLEPDERWF